MEAAHRLNLITVVLDNPADAPAKQLNAMNEHVHGSFADASAIYELATKCDIITAEIEHVNTDALEKLQQPQFYNAALGGKRVDIQPDWRTICTIQDKYKQHIFLQESSIPTAEVLPVHEPTKEALRDVAVILGYPYMLKSRTMAYDGRGNFALHSEEDTEEALNQLGTRPLYAEKWANFKMELSVMVVKGKDCVKGYPVTETVHEQSILRVCYVPARGVSNEIQDRAKQLAEDAVSLFPGKGVFGVEMFLMDDGKNACISHLPAVLTLAQIPLLSMSLLPALTIPATTPSMPALYPNLKFTSGPSLTFQFPPLQPHSPPALLLPSWSISSVAPRPMTHGATSGLRNAHCPSLELVFISMVKALVALVVRWGILPLLAHPCVK